MNIDIALRITGDEATFSLFTDGEKKTITPQGFKRTGITLNAPGKEVSLKWKGDTQHVVAYRALNILLKYLAPHQKAGRIRIFTNNPTTVQQLAGQWDVKSDDLLPLYGAVKQLQGNVQVGTLAPERLRAVFSRD